MLTGSIQLINMSTTYLALGASILTTGQPNKLTDAISTYRDSLKKKDASDLIHRELHRFTDWCGQDKNLEDLSPALLSKYAEEIGGTGTTPQASNRLQVIRGFLSYARKEKMIGVNLSQHIRIPKRKTSGKSGSSGDSNKIEMSPEGHARLLEQLEGLKSERAPLASQIRDAAEDKDVRENAPLEAAREQLGLVEGRIRNIEVQLNSAIIIDHSASSPNTVRIGSRVSLTDITNKSKKLFTLVDRNEVNSLEGKISDVSPIGKTLVNKTVGQEIEVVTPRGKAKYEITSISN